MSSGNSRLTPFLTGVFCTVMVFLTVFTAVAIGELKGATEEQRNLAPHRHSVGAKQIAGRLCANMSGEEALECVHDVVAGAEETARSEQELAAQQTTALAAVLALIISVATTLVGALGLLFIRDTLVATQKATKAAVDQHRPWLKFTEIEFAEINPGLDENRSDGTDRVQVQIDAIVKNIGSTPAMNLRWVPALWFLDGATANRFDTATRSINDILDQITAQWKRRRDGGPTLFPDETHNLGRYTIGTDVLQPSNALSVDRSDDRRIGTMAMVVVGYEISSGDFAFTAVPFRILWTADGNRMTAIYAAGSELTFERDFFVSRYTFGERAT